ncbi:MAG: matrixin family metalloprotease [Thermoleophilia bacterium]
MAAGLLGSPTISSADAYVFEGKRWPSTTVSYYNTVPAFTDTVRTSAFAWANSGVKVRFVPARSRATADFVIRRNSVNPRSGCFGLATVGRQPKGQAWVSLNAAGCFEVLTHEFGHILGLGHSENRCALMWKGVPPPGRRAVGRHCDIFDFTAPDPNVVCQLLKRDDIAGAARLYGRKEPPTRECPPWPARGPLDVELHHVGPEAFELRGTLPAPSPEPWSILLVKWRPPWANVDFEVGFDECPAPPIPARGDYPVWDVSAPPAGKRFRWTLPYGSGSQVCVVAFTQDALGLQRTDQWTFPVPPDKGVSLPIPAVPTS